MTELVLVGTDGSETATAAVSEAAGPAGSPGATLLIVTAFPLESLGQTDVSVESLAQEGDTADVILEVAEERKADVVVVGNKGMGGIKRFLLGSVPSRVARHAPCSVLIVRTT